MATGLVHTVVGKAGNVADVMQAHALLHGGEKVAIGDAGYQGVAKRPENIGTNVEWHTAMKLSLGKALKKNKVGRLTENLEQTNASVSAKVEHCPRVVKCPFHHCRNLYRGRAKNTARRYSLLLSPIWC